jgi:hypothetical protein
MMDVLLIGTSEKTRTVNRLKQILQATYLDVKEKLLRCSFQPRRIDEIEVNESW